MTKAPDGSENAYFCKDNLVAKLSNLGTHENSKKHKQRIENTSKGLCRNITSMFKLLCFFKRFVMGTNNNFIFYFSTLKVQFSIHSSLLSGMRLQYGGANQVNPYPLYIQNCTPSQSPHCRISLLPTNIDSICRFPVSSAQAPIESGTASQAFCVDLTRLIRCSRVLP